MPTSLKGSDIQAVFDEARSPQIKRINIGKKAFKIAIPFPSPEDWRDEWIYFILMDRFNNPEAPPLHSPWNGKIGAFQGGTFNGIRQQLDYLKQLGVGAIWLSPVLKNCQYSPFTYHGYGIQDFLQIDPRFASEPQLAEEELRALVDEAHTRGIYVIFDIVLNHSGDVFEYVLPDGSGASEADWRDEPYGIRWRDDKGHGRPDWTEPPDDPVPDATVWPEELHRNVFFRRKGRGGEEGGDFASLKELVTGFTEFNEEEGFHYPVRNVLIKACQYIIAKYDVDGFRIDTLKYIEPEFAKVFGNAVREFALSIGKKNFFTFGEVYDDEETIARFIGRQALEEGDLVGVDAALDFPLFFKLPAMTKGLIAPAEVINMFEHRKEVEKGILSSHGEASRFFVTFLDNHDQRERFYFSPEDDPSRFAAQLTMGAGLLFALQGIPCLYYGTEQGLHGSGDADLAVREALWGKPDAFNQHHPFYQTIQELARARNSEPALRYGRQYFRPISGDGFHFGISRFPAGVLAFSRILNDREAMVVANTSTEQDWTGDVIVDLALNPIGSVYNVLFSNKESGSVMTQKLSVVGKGGGEVEIHEMNGAVTNGPARALNITLRNMEIKILGRAR